MSVRQLRCPEKIFPMSFFKQTTQIVIFCWIFSNRVSDHLQWKLIVIRISYKTINEHNRLQQSIQNTSTFLFIYSNINHVLPNVCRGVSMSVDLLSDCFSLFRCFLFTLCLNMRLKPYKHWFNPTRAHIATV